MTQPLITPVATESAPTAIGPYSQAVQWESLVFCSGQLPLTAGPEPSMENDISLATELVLNNLREVLQAAGADLDTVVKTTIYLTDLKDFEEVNRVYARFFGNHRPARACIEVSALPKNARLEMDAIAIRSA